MNSQKVFIGILTGLLVVAVAGYFGYDSLQKYLPGSDQALSQTTDNKKNQESTHTKKQSGEHTEKTNKAKSKQEGGKGGTHSEHNQDGPPVVHLTPEQRKPLSISVQKAQRGSAQSTITRPATVQFNADSVVRIGPRMTGKVEKNLVNLGEHVTQGEQIALLSSTRLGEARAKYLTAQAQLETREAEYDREKTLYDQDISSEADMLEARAHFKQAQAELRAARERLRLLGLSPENFEGVDGSKKRPLSDFYLTAPINGVLQKRAAVAGETIKGDETPYHVVNPSTMWVMIDAYEQDIPHLETRQKVTVNVRSLPGESFEGRVNWISESLDEQSRTLPVRAAVKNHDGLLKQGMFGQATIHSDREVRTALVPVGAVQEIHGKSRVFVPGHENGAYRALPVKTGDENDGMIEIISGLNPGERFVAKGAFDLKSVLTAKSRSASHGH